MTSAQLRTLGLRTHGLTTSYDGRQVLHGVDIAFPPSAVTVVLGANASGKSTLLRTLARLLPPTSGAVTLDGDDLRNLHAKALARRIGLLPQSSTAPPGITVGELVARGRYPHQRLLQQWSADDADAVTAAVTATGMEDLVNRPLDELSGGQRQRAWIALLLAQETPVLLLDEPTTYLDIAHQLDVLELIRDLNRTQGRTVVMVLHDLDQACRYADELIVLKDGRIVATGAPAEVMTAELVAHAFGIEAEVQPHPRTGHPMVLPIASLSGRVGS
ncbi:ABC transporter ATP-binding protein [Microbacterium sp. TNHR37B]|uniref:ABC transporter ATP-binding protein n=1 Tax=Microbacterium sp. TNHR37B TaxID=1775956 RepID=UPI0007B2B41E|nr:ABC transporter ATP-binding protein [Microbacterium sp. TNHR37B]KZE91886.1 putative siderophore transport system ATP-binding protein YusV [Microbacterium sp. TNHR37B]